MVVVATWNGTVGSAAQSAGSPNFQFQDPALQWGGTPVALATFKGQLYCGISDGAIWACLGGNEWVGVTNINLPLTCMVQAFENKLFIGAADGTIWSWDGSSLKCEKTKGWGGHATCMTEFANATVRQLVVGLSDGTVVRLSDAGDWADVDTNVANNVQCRCCFWWKAASAVYIGIDGGTRLLKYDGASTTAVQTNWGGHPCTLAALPTGLYTMLDDATLQCVAPDGSWVTKAIDGDVHNSFVPQAGCVVGSTLWFGGDQCDRSSQIGPLGKWALVAYDGTTWSYDKTDMAYKPPSGVFPSTIAAAPGSSTVYAAYYRLRPGPTVWFQNFSDLTWTLKSQSGYVKGTVPQTLAPLQANTTAWLDVPMLIKAPTPYRYSFVFGLSNNMELTFDVLINTNFITFETTTTYGPWKGERKEYFRYGACCFFVGLNGKYLTPGCPNESVTTWQQDFMPLLKTVPLNELCTVYSHDSGMCKTNVCTTFGGPGATVTQSLDIGGQFNTGCRMIEIRPAKWQDQYYTSHFGKMPSMKIGQGAAGQLLSEIVQQINDFTASHNELIVIQYACQNNCSIDSGASYTDWNRDDPNDPDFKAVWGILSGIKNCYVAPTPDTVVWKSTLGDLICPGGQPRAQVVFFYNDGGYRPAAWPADCYNKVLTMDKNFPYSGCYTSPWMGADPVAMVNHDNDCLFKARTATSRPYFLYECPALIPIPDYVLPAGDELLEAGRADRNVLWPGMMTKVDHISFPSSIQTDAVENPLQVMMALAINILVHYKPASASSSKMGFQLARTVHSADSFAAYLSHKDVPGLFEEILRDLRRHQPDDPKAYIARAFTRM